MSKIRIVWNQTSNIVAWLGILLAGYHFYIQELNKTHDVTVAITSIDVADKKVILGVLYKNNGDYQETITNATVSMVRPEVNNLNWSSSVQSCFEPVTIESKKTLHTYYKIPLDSYYVDDSYVVEDTITHDLKISFKYLLPNNAVGIDKFNFGSIVHSVSKGAIKSFEVSDNSHKFSFNLKQNYGITKVVRPLKGKDTSLLCNENV